LSTFFGFSIYFKKLRHFKAKYKVNLQDTFSDISNGFLGKWHFLFQKSDEPTILVLHVARIFCA
jgi:hypothetical protein